MKIRPFEPADADAVIELNAANVPDVGPMDADKLAVLVEDSPYFQVVEADNGAIVGLLIGLDGDSRYASPNYRWFVERHGSQFAYVDRIALAEPTRGYGLGPELYHGFEQWAANAGLAVLCAEVNTIPPNDRSLRFHQIFGFEVVAHCRPYGPDEEVAMVEKSLRSETPSSEKPRN